MKLGVRLMFSCHHDDLPASPAHRLECRRGPRHRRDLRDDRGIQCAITGHQRRNHLCGCARLGEQFRSPRAESHGYLVLIEMYSEFGGGHGDQSGDAGARIDQRHVQVETHREVHRSPRPSARCRRIILRCRKFRACRVHGTRVGRGNRYASYRLDGGATPGLFDGAARRNCVQPIDSGDGPGGSTPRCAGIAVWQLNWWPIAAVGVDSDVGASFR